MQYALTRPVSPRIAECALTFLGRQAIDVELAVRQHAAYEAWLRRLGAQVVQLPATPDLPDSVFVEDTAVVVDELAVITAPALPSRRAEVRSTQEAMARYRPTRSIDGAGRLEGGDVVRVGRTLYAGLSRRTNPAGIDQLAALVAPFGYQVQQVEVSGCLHLKTACTYLGRQTLLANPDWADTKRFSGMEVIEVAPEEPMAGNALLLGGALLLPASASRTRDRLLARGFEVYSVDVSELEKAEAGVTCCSIVFENR